MADIELMIRIPESEYGWIMKSDDTVFANVASKECMLNAIKHGVPIPKGHGRLIDADAYIFRHSVCGWLEDLSVDEFNNITPTIIERG